MSQAFPNPHVIEAINASGIGAPAFAAVAQETYSECGEDLIAVAMLRAMCLRNGVDLSEVRYLDIGAHHPISDNNTYLLYRRYGCRGVLVEANPDLIEPLVHVRPMDKVIHAAVAPADTGTTILYKASISDFSSILDDFAAKIRGHNVTSKPIDVPSVDINSLLRTLMPRRGITLLSLDVEGAEYRVLECIEFHRWRPSVLLVETADHYEPGVGRQVMNLLERNEYRLHAVTDRHLIHVARELSATASKEHL